MKARSMRAKFKDVFEGTRAAVGGYPAIAQAVFSAQSRQGEGLSSSIAVRQFDVDIDQPEGLGGKDSAPNPVEYVLAALGACQETTYRVYADALGIPLDGVSVELKGVLDLRGFFDADPTVRPGYRKIEAEVLLDSPAPEEDLLRLKAVVDEHCPVLDMLRNPTPVEVWLRTPALSVAQ